MIVKQDKSKVGDNTKIRTKRHASKYEWTAQKQKKSRYKKRPMSEDTLHCLQRDRIQLKYFWLM
ncbi:MAG TPA: hypothetical protein VFS97_08740 [Nitrososphaeraceae archaeon]|nr:hypothetical protein [Nitrososphaeraceae archaeon]